MAAVDGIHIVLEILSFFRHLCNVLTGRKFRLYPTAKQAQVFSQWIGCQRVIRNAKVEETRLNAWLRRASMFSDRPGSGDAAKAANMGTNMGCGTCSHLEHMRSGAPL